MALADYFGKFPHALHEREKSLPKHGGGRVPHRCPVCLGRGSVPHDFYTALGFANSTNREKCRSCDGERVLWS